MEITPQNELDMLQSYINHLKKGKKSNNIKKYEQLYQTKKKALNKTKKNLNNAAANAFLMSEFGSKNGRTRSPALNYSSKPNMPTRSLPPLPPGVKGGRRKRKTHRR